MQANWYFAPRVLREGEFKEAVEKAVGTILKDPIDQIVVSYPRRDGRPGVREDDIRLSVDSLRAIVDLSKIDLSIEVDPSTQNGYTYISLVFQTAGEVLRTYAGGSKSIDCLERIAVNLALERTNPPKDDSEGLELRVAALEREVAQIERKLKCFISFKFDDTRTVEQINVLKRMLKALNMEWITGEEFEPRRIEDKVKARLRADVDFLIGVLTKAGQSNWIRDELGDANSRGLFVILLKEEGANFDQGIFGSLEYIPYDTIIEQTFPSLVEGINFVKAEIAKKSATPA